MYQSGRAEDEAKKRKSPAESGRVGITDVVSQVTVYDLLVITIILNHDPF